MRLGLVALGRDGPAKTRHPVENHFWNNQSGFDSFGLATTRAPTANG